MLDDLGGFHFSVKTDRLLAPTMTPATVQAMQLRVREVFVADALLDYVQAIVAFTRESMTFDTGLSPRAAIGLLRAAQAWALIHGHNGVRPEDVQAVVPNVVTHRLVPRDDTALGSAGAIGRLILESVDIP